jgi:hypothetical protein
MALAAGGRRDDARQVIRSRQRWVSESVGAGNTNVTMTAEIGLPSSQAAIAFVDGRHDDVIDLLMPIRRVFHRFGGSHAQRDALHRTLLEAAIRGGRWNLARALTAERLGVRESSVYGWTQRARVLAGLGDAAGAAGAHQRADALRSAFAGTGRSGDRN